MQEQPRKKGRSSQRNPERVGLQKTVPLPRQYAFVVQFQPETDIERGLILGRIEHVLSGEASHFGSLEELRAFIARVFTAMHEWEK